MNDPHESLTGIWDGLYSYAGVLTQPESTFTAVLFQSGGMLSGTIHETMRRRVVGDVAASAFVDGRVDGTVVTFSKTYDGSGGQTHVVNYDGRLAGDEIDGTWSIAVQGGVVTGRFLMIRGRRAETQTEVFAEETV